jgi:hypothetical protein
MRRGVRVGAAALLLALALVPSSLEAPGVAAPRATLAHDGAVEIAGRRQFVIGAGWPSTSAVPRALTLGIDILQSNGPGATQLAISEAVGSRGWVVPDYSFKQRRQHYRNAIGYSLPDEPDEKGLLPAAAAPAGGPRLPPTQRAAKTGVLIVQTLTSHFMSTRSKPDGIGSAEYRQYIANADVVLTDVYPFAHGCVDPGITLSTVYDAMVELKRLAPAKAVGEWIETGPIEGHCGQSPVSPPAARAEAWAAVAGGAQALYWFTHTFTKGYWDDFDVSPDMANAIATTNAEIARYGGVVLARRDPTVVSAPEDPVKVGLRTFGGRPYLIAVNLSDAPVALADDAVAADTWQPALPGLTLQPVTEVTTGTVGLATDGRITGTLPAWGLRIYTWVPRVVSGSAGGRSSG